MTLHLLQLLRESAILIFCTIRKNPISQMWRGDRFLASRVCRYQKVVVAWRILDRDIRVNKREFAWSNDNKSRMRVDKREFVWQFYQLSCPRQTRRVAWELRRESLYGSFSNSHVAKQRKQECWLILPCVSSKNSHQISSKFEPEMSTWKFIRVAALFVSYVW